MTNSKLTLVAVASMLSVGTTLVVAATDVTPTPLIPASPYSRMLPPPAPSDTKGGLTAEGLGWGLDFLLNWWVKNEVKSSFQAAVARGLAEANKSGQQGVLLNVQYAENRTATDQWISGGPVGEGVSIVGIGPDPGAVCFITRCDKPSGAQLNPSAARRYTNDSDYYWVGRTANPKDIRRGYVISRYSRQALETWTTQVVINDSAAKSFAKATNIRIVDGLAQRLAEEANTGVARAEISRILALRDQARTELDRVESELATELNRQAERAKTLETLKVMSWALSAGQLANMAAISRKDDGTSTLSLEQQLKAGGAHIEVLRSRSAQWTDKFDGTTKFLLDQTVQYSVPAPRLAPATIRPKN